MAPTVQTQVLVTDEPQELLEDRIFEAARAVFASDGVRGARMGKIAEEAECARATLYRYYPNKDALLLAYLARESAEFISILEDRLRNVRSFKKRIVESVALSVELIRAREEVAPFFTEETIGLTAQLTANAQAVRAQLVERLQAESDSEAIDGQLRKDVSAKDASEWLTRAIFSLATLPLEQRSNRALRRYLGKMLVPPLVEE